MNTNPAKSTPTVQAVPTFAKGETLENKYTGESHEVIEVTDAGYVCAGRAGVLPKDAVRKPLTEEDRKALEAGK